MVSDEGFKAPEELRQGRIPREPKLLVPAHQRIDPPQDGFGLHLDKAFDLDLIVNEKPQGGRLPAGGDPILALLAFVPERTRPHQASRGGLLPFMGDLMDREEYRG